MKEKSPKEKSNKLSLEQATYLFDNVVTNAYLKALEDCRIVPWNENNELPQIRWYQITKIVIEKDVFFTDKLSMLYNALHKNAKEVILALEKNNGKIELFLGTRDFDGTKCVSGDILEAGFQGYFPGVRLCHKHKPSFDKKEEERKEESVSCVSVLASLRDDKKDTFAQGVEKLINASLSIPKFTAFFIAENVSEETTKSMIQGFNAMQTWLSPMAESQITFAESHTEGMSESLTNSFSQSVTDNISKTVTHSKGWSKTKGNSGGRTEGSNSNINIIFIGGGDNEGTHRDWNRSRTKSGNDSVAKTKARSVANQKGKQQQKGISQSDTTSNSIQITQKNSQIKRYNDLIDKQVERLQNGIPFGLWSVATYFVAPLTSTALKLANIYKGCIVGEKSNLSIGAINCWKGSDAKEIMKYLDCKTHPQFVFENVFVTPGTIVTSEELAIHLSLPQSSVPGILVREEQSFGRNVILENTCQESDSIEIGSIMHLGEKTKERVSLSIKNLSKHTFITGTTGSGKSNTLYCLISKLIEKGKKCLVIEPAKGEYKRVFGGRDDFNVFGSNPKQAPLLHINPFEFPENIDVYQHIDSLVEVFNACWPMYAAMPQVLSHSIIEAYRACGWNMEQSCNPKKVFPTIENVLDRLKFYINSSEYSSDTKGDYIGSLETRLRSLCDGTIGRMINGNSISNEKLFNENVVVDLSQVRSMENQSLIMGLLILKLDEFRNSEGNGMDLPLQHVTVLEEAHHLLKRTSTVQNAESSNVAGMAVEKIANSMAEMRTYGEGFIIADQSPSMLDLSTIRNTNTKIIMALPEKDDRETAGKSIGLDDKHIEEISRLKTGEAIVFQSGWEEAVKAEIDFYENDKTQPWEYSPMETIDDNRAKDSFRKACFALLDCYTTYDAELDHQGLLEILVNADVSIGCYNRAKDWLDSMTDAAPEKIALLFVAIVGEEIFEAAKCISDTALFNEKVSKALSQKIGIVNDDRMNGFVNMYMKGCSQKASVPFYEGWLQTTLKSK